MYAAYFTDYLLVGVNGSYFDLLYSNSMCKQSSIPTSILMLRTEKIYKINND